MFKLRNISATGSEHQELQVAAMADAAQFLQPAPPSADRDATSEQSDGVVVFDALPDAQRLPVTPGLQGVVLQPPDWYDWGQPGVQRESRQTSAQGTCVFASWGSGSLIRCVCLFFASRYNNGSHWTVHMGCVVVAGWLHDCDLYLVAGTLLVSSNINTLCMHFVWGYFSWYTWSSY